MKNIFRYLFLVYLCSNLPVYTLPAFGNTPPFFSPSQKTGSITITLYPMENVSSETPTLVTFGMPFTRNSVSETDLDFVRIISADSTEIPSYIDQLSPWRHVSDAVLDAVFLPNRGDTKPRGYSH